jgi:hypothetical protein
MSAVLQIHWQRSFANSKPAQISVWGVDYLDLCRQYAIILSSMVAFVRPESLAHNQCRGTNPIGRARISGLVQSGFNDVAPHHHASVAPRDLTEPSRFPCR